MYETSPARIKVRKDVLGPDSISRCHLTSTGNPILEIRRFYDHLISKVGFSILVRRHLYIESAQDISLSNPLIGWKIRDDWYLYCNVSISLLLSCHPIDEVAPSGKAPNFELLIFVWYVIQWCNIFSKNKGISLIFRNISNIGDQ